MATLSSVTSFVDGDPATPTHFNSKVDPVISAVRVLDSQLGDRGVSVTALGVVADGSDQYATLGPIFSQYSNIYFPAGRYGTSQTLSLRSFQHVSGPGAGLVSIVALDSLVTLALGSGCTSVSLEGLTLDVRGSSRTTLTQGLIALRLENSTDVRLSDLRFEGGIGPSTGGSSAVVALSDVTRCDVSHVVIRSLGSYTRPCDGIYARGDKIHIADSVAEGCSDTGFVLEGCTDSSIIDSTATGCAAGYAISAATGASGSAVRLSNLILSGWSAPNTGGIQIGALGTCTLRSVDLDGLTATQQSTGTGSAIFVRTTGAGVLTDVALRGMTVSGTMAYIVQATGAVGLTLASVQATTIGLANYSIGSGCSDVLMSGLRSRSSLSYGIYATYANDLVVTDNVITGLGGQMNYGVYYDSGCTRMITKWNEIRGAASQRVGSVVGVEPQVVDVYNSGPGGIRLGQDGFANLFVASGGSDLRTDVPFRAAIVHARALYGGITMVSANYSASTIDFTVSVNSTSTTTVTLPNPSSVVSQMFNVQRFSTGTVVINATSGASLNDNSTMTLTTVMSSLRFQSYGSGYISV